MMLIVVTLGWVLILASVYCGLRARLLDRQLRRFMPPAIERRFRQRTLHEMRDGYQGLDSSLETIPFAVIPPRWQRRFYEGQQARLVDRLWLLLSSMFLLVASGLFLIALALR